ncbi:hypothetical protein BH160DRAFT_1180 [Burkholderia sp. H160]|nr:hypothetical protein BH160DRAFT_1180 [Burkholderia sp. H160]
MHARRMKWIFAFKDIKCIPFHRKHIDVQRAALVLRLEWNTGLETCCSECVSQHDLHGVFVIGPCDSRFSTLEKIAKYIRKSEYIHRHYVLTVHFKNGTVLDVEKSLTFPRMRKGINYFIDIFWKDRHGKKSPEVVPLEHRNSTSHGYRLIWRMQVTQLAPKEFAHEIDVSLSLSRFLHGKSTFQVHVEKFIRCAEKVVGGHINMDRIFAERKLSKLSWSIGWPKKCKTVARNGMSNEAEPTSTASRHEQVYGSITGR